MLKHAKTGWDRTKHDNIITKTHRLVTVDYFPYLRSSKLEF